MLKTELFSKKYKGKHFHPQEEDVMKRSRYWAVMKNSGLTFSLFALASCICFLIQKLDQQRAKPGRNNVYVLLIFMLAVVLISRFTDGYWYGAIAAAGAVFAVNYAFTYPFFAFDFSLSGYPLTALTVVVCIGISMVSSHMKRHAEMEVEMEKEKNRANLLRAVSHDIRTPLTSITGSASALLENDLSPEDQRKLVQGIYEEGNWLIRAAENLLSVTRIQGDSASLEKTGELAEEIVGEAMTRFRKDFPQTELVANVPDSFLFVPMDGMLIEQVLINLMENAVIHGGSPVVELSVKATKRKAVFQVADRGCGIPKRQERDLCALAEESRQSGDNKKNMGIGLSVCKSIVTAHGGGMKAARREGGGAVFSFWLPLEEEKKDDAKQRFYHRG